ncbi:MAG TPA: diguanylate cyclase [Gemmatimonadales bacterium]|nr:diguanylate cyclase [Gemmatimonadales bacterium]
MGVWEESIARPLRALHLGSIRSQILVFAVLATLIPTLATTLGSYRQARRLLNDGIAQDLRGASSDAARETQLWLDARLDDLRGSAHSYVVTENLARTQGRDASQALGRLRDYLNSVRERFPDVEALLLIDPSGRAVATTTGRTGGVRPPPDGLTGLRTGEAFVGDAYWDAVTGKAAMVIAVPIRDADGRFLAAFTAKINLHAVQDVLQRLAQDDRRDVYLMTDQGRFVITSRVSSAELMRSRLADAATRVLLEREGQTVGYKRADGQEVLGALRPVPQLRWAAVAELPRAEAFRQLGQLRASTTWLIVILLVVVGLLTYALVLVLVRPLGRLATAASKGAAGDLSTELPVSGVGEVGHFTRSLNTLLGRLRERESAGELERLSVTDALTGLYNRRHLMGTLASEAQRARRLRRPFSVLLMDVDHFKQYNDTHGHLAGDAALSKIAEILRKQTRAVDCVARYGGEEFLVVLLETTVATAALVAERIRARVAAEPFGGGQMTVSIGVAECPAHGDTPESLIANADAAMYEAKAGGRDRVVAVSGKQEVEKEKKRRRKGEA